MNSKPEDAKEIIYDDFYRMIVLILEQDLATIRKGSCNTTEYYSARNNDKQSDAFYLDPNNKQMIIEAIFLLFTDTASTILCGIQGDSQENSLVSASFLAQNRTNSYFRKTTFLMILLLVLKRKSMKDLMNNKEKVNLLHYINGQKGEWLQLFPQLFIAESRKALLSTGAAATEISINENLHLTSNENAL